MSQTVYRLFMMKFTEAWYQLSKEEQDNMGAKMEKVFNNSGGKNIFIADTSWSSEEWLFIGVDEYPDIEAVQKHIKDINELNWFRYVESKVILGTKWEQS